MAKIDIVLNNWEVLRIMTCRYRDTPVVDVRIYHEKPPASDGSVPNGRLALTNKGVCFPADTDTLGEVIGALQQIKDGLEGAKNAETA